MSEDKLKYIFISLDLETTGRKITEDNITQIGISIASVSQNNQWTQLPSWKTFVHLIDQTLSEEISQITGITNEDLQNAPELGQAFENMKNHFKTTCPLDIPRILVIYNAKFDIPMFIHNLRRSKLNPVESLRSLCIEYIFDPMRQCKDTFDTYELTGKNNENELSYKLENVYHCFTGKTLEGAHDALVDATGLLELIQHNRFYSSFEKAIVSEEKCEFLTPCMPFIVSIANEQKTKIEKSKKQINTGTSISDSLARKKLKTSA